MKNRDLIHDNDFCMITSDKFAEEGIKVGQRVFVAGHRAIPEDERDPYTQRIKFFVYLLDKNKHVDFAKGMFLMDPKSLKRVNKGEQHKLLALLEADIEAAEPVDVATTQYEVADAVGNVLDPTTH